MSFCRSCRAVVEWARSTNGRPMILDPAPTPDGNLVVVDGVARKRTPDDEGLEPRRSHFATCPQAPAWRHQ